MVSRFERGRDRPRAVDGVGARPGDHPQHRRYPVALAYLTAFVAEQRKRQLVLVSEGGVPIHRVGTDPDHLGAGIGEDLEPVSYGGFRYRFILPKHAFYMGKRRTVT